MVNGLALSGRFASSSPKGRASGETENFVWTAKGSPFGRGVTAGDKKGNLARKRLRGSLLIPDGHAAGVGVQALALGKIGDAGGYFAQRFPGVVEEAGLLYKVVYAQGA